MNSPLVTIIIPSYKRTVEYLSRAVMSVQKQTYPNIEIIVIDDSPEDFDGRDSVEKYMETIVGDNIKYFQNEKNMGGSLSRNRGIKESSGTFISFLDDDDEYEEEKIEKQVKFMIDGGYDLSFMNMTIYNGSGKVVDFREYPDIPNFSNDTLLKYHLMKHLTGTPTFMFKADKLKEIGGFDDAEMGQEFYLMLKSIESGFSIGYLPESEVKVYKHEGEAISQGKNKIIGEKKLYNFKKKYFDIFSNREKRFISFRHWAVMLVAYKRNHEYFKMLGAGVKAFLVSPVDFITQPILFFGRVIKSR